MIVQALTFSFWLFTGATADGGTPPRGVLTRAPVLERSVEAEFPSEALDAHLSATVVLQIDISDAGAVTHAQVVEPAGHGFDASALAAVGQFHFTPAEVDGHPAPVRILYRYAFAWRAPDTAHAPSEDVNAQPFARLEGRVLQRGTRLPRAGADVVLEDVGLHQSTDEKGRFAFAQVAPGFHRIKVSSLGSLPFSTEEMLTAGKLRNVTLYVGSRFVNPYETVVAAQRELKEVTETSLQAAEVQRIPGSLGDTLKVVQNLPGVARPPFNGGALIIRGTSPDESGVFLDGLNLPLLYHFGGLTSVYNSELLASVDYFPGNFSAFYGGVIGGVVDVQSRSPKRDGFHGVVSISLLESSAVLEGPLTDSLSFSIGARRSYVDLVLAALPAIGGLTEAPKYYDAQLKLEWRPSRHHTVTLLALTSDDRFGLLFSRPSDADLNISGSLNLHTGFNQLRLRDVYQSGAWRVDSQLLGGTQLLKFGIGPARDLELDIADFTARSTVEYVLRPELTLASGLEIEFSRARVIAHLAAIRQEGQPRPSSASPVFADNSLYNIYTPAVWVEARWHPVPRLLIVPGLRSDTFIITHQATPRRDLGPRLAVRYALTEPLTLKAGVGLYHAPPLNSQPTKSFGNPDLLTERSLQYTAGVEWTPLNLVSLSSEVFYNDIARYIVPTSATVVRDGAVVPLRLGNDGVGRVYGLELLLRRQVGGRFFGWVAYTLSRSERRDTAGSPWRRFDYDQTHVLTAIGSYKLGRGWEVGARFRYATGNPYTPVTGAVRDENLDIFLPTYGGVNSARLPSFNQLDIRVDKTFVFNAWMLDLFLDVENVYNNSAAELVAYSYNDRQHDFVRGLPLLPILGLKGSF